jgi:alcohol-forming fatty acyl-CoA reductase
MIWVPRFNGTSCTFMYRFYFVLYHYIPALFFDIALMIKGSNMRLFKVYAKVFYHTQLLDYFMQKSWKFDDINMRDLYRTMSKQDHADFPVIMKAEDYEPHAYRGTDGLRKYFFKENDDDLLIARKRYKLFNVLHNMLLALVYGCLIYFFFFLLN